MFEGENNYAGKRKHTTISKQTDAVPERDFEGMVSASNPAGDSGHAAETRHHDLPAGDFPLHQTAQRQVRSENSSTDKEASLGKAVKGHRKILKKTR